MNSTTAQSLLDNISWQLECANRRERELWDKMAQREAVVVACVEGYEKTIAEMRELADRMEARA